MKTLQELEDNPKFATLDYADQTQLRADYFNATVATDPKFTALGDESKMTLFNEYVARMPVIEVKESDFFRKSAATVMKMKLGEPTGIDEAIGLSAMRTGTKQMLLPTLAMKSIDAIASLFNPDIKDPLYADYYGKDGEKIDQWLKMNISKYGGEAAEKKLATNTFAIGMLGGFAEFAAMTLGFGAMGGALGGTSAGAAKGVGGVAGAKALGAMKGRGILTGEYVNSLVTGALKTGPFSGPLAKSLLAITAEGVQSGIVQTGMDVLRLGLQDDLVKKTNGETWDAIANNFGINVAMNYVGWGAVKALRTIGRATAKSIKGFELDPVKLTREVFTLETNPFARVASKTYVEKAVLPAQVDIRLNHIDPKHEVGFGVFSQSYGWEAKFNNGKVVLENMKNPDLRLPETDIATAARRLGEIVATGEPALVLRADQLPKNLKVQAAFDSNKSALLKQTQYKLDGLMPPEQITRFLYPEDGIVQPANLKLFGRNYLESQGVPREVAERLSIELHGADFGGRKPSTDLNVVVDSKIKGLGDEQTLVNNFIRDLDKIVANNSQLTGPRAPMRLAPPSIDANHASLSSVKAGADLLGVPVRIKNNIIFLGDSDVPIRSAREANAALLKLAMDQGKLSVDQLGVLMARRHGLTLKQVTSPIMSPKGAATKIAARVGGDAGMTTQSFELLKPSTGGKAPMLVASAPTIEQLFDRYPQLDPRLPSFMAPEYFIIDPDLKTLRVQQTIATGPGTQLLEMGGKFTSVQSDSFVEVVKGLELDKAYNGTYVIRNNELGFIAEFLDLKSAKKALRDIPDEIAKMKTAFGTRDMRAWYAPDGTLVGVASDGSTKRFKTMVEAEKWISETDMVSWAKELMPVDPQLLKEAAAQVSEEAVKLARIIPDKKLTPFTLPDKLTSWYGKWFLPTELAMVVDSKIHGKGELLGLNRQAQNAARINQAIDNKVSAHLLQISKGQKYADRVRYQVLLGNDQSQWARISQDGFKKPLTDLDLERLAKWRDFYDTEFAASGMADWKKNFQYAGRIRDWAEAHPDDIIDAVSANDYLTRIFGQRPTGMEFFGEKARASDVLRVALKEDVLDVAMAYSNALTKHRYLDPVMKSIQTDITKLKGKYPASELDFFQGSLDEMMNVTKTASHRIFKRQSKQFFAGIQNTMKKIPLLRDMPMATEQQVGDLIDKFNNLATVSTQSRPWVILRNMSEVTRLGAILGDNRTVMKAFNAVLDEPADESIKMWLKAGGLTGAGFIDSIQGSHLNIWRTLLKYGENMDVLTRGVAYKSTGMLLDDAWPLFKKGLIDERGLLKKTGLSILDKQPRLTILDAMHRGDVELAKTVYGEAISKLVFMDYTKMNRAGIQRGVLGKAIGKFGTFPLGTIGLYHRILTSGDPIERVARAGRIVANSLVLYQAAKAMGVEYEGFKWNDPISFQGGPAWHMLADGSQFIGDDSRSKQARASFLRGLRLLSPTVMTMHQMTKVMEHLDRGDIYSAGIAATGGPVRRDLEWQRR